MSILEVIEELCPVQLLKLTGDVIKEGVVKHPILYHRAVDALCRHPKSHNEAAQIIYILRNYGYNINHVNERGSTALLQYILSCDLVKDNVVEAMLRCNADIFIKNENNTCAFEEVRKPHISRSTKTLFARYMPGIWRAVAADDVHQVRFLVNQWCRVDVEQDGQSLVHLTFDVGTENIIGIISGIHASMALAHGVLAGDVKYVEQLLQKKGNINVNLKNMGDGGTTPLYYAALQNNTEIIKLLLSLGAQVHCTITMNDKTELPLLFALMLEYPQVHTATLKLLLPLSPVHVETIHYKGKNILFHCVDCDIDPSMVESILEVSSATMVTSREEGGLTAREYAERQECEAVLKVIDRFVYKWWTDKANDKNRKVLALHSYRPIPTDLGVLSLDSANNHDNHECDASRELLAESLTQYQQHICKFHQALELEDEGQVQTDIIYLSCDHFQEFMCDSRPQDKGQPALHKAVLRGNTRLTHLLAETLVYKQGCRLDSIRDQFFRTALHYAYALDDNEAIVNVLVDHGASDFAMDKDGRSPLAFRDRRELVEMKELLHYQLMQDFSLPEPDPWTAPLPIPMVGYMKNCNHTHHVQNKFNHSHHFHQISTAIPNKSVKHNRKVFAIPDRSLLDPEQELQANVTSKPPTVKVNFTSASSENKFDPSENFRNLMLSDVESQYYEDDGYYDEERYVTEYDEVESKYVIDDDDIDLSSDDECLDDEEELVEEEFRRQGNICIIL
ncbi:serine/threonine-protein phosphatase 6 regulatory ankyrin repeat subunit A-like [Argopecten irradians]|uniref:serine/threonine-protein phosphatase 6 regulatory ankyrin repeat subunit A-like n=1 Tax=Argopecten irradians TaxID=31199 RepID=UPI00371A20B8